MNPPSPPHFHVAIAGSGFGGLGMAIRLKQEGIEDFVIFERAQDVGGVWRDNSYPGCACDVQSHLYSFSFAPNPNWSHTYSAQPEIHAYLRDCADRFALRPHIRFGHTVLDARWDEDLQLWHLETSGGRFTADVFVSAAGALSDPAIPQMPGLESFQGKVMHSARWDHGYPLAGRKVAVIGTGASAIQFVPRIQPQVGKLVLVQRTAPWVLSRGDRAIGPWKQWMYRNVPGVQLLVRSLLYVMRELLVFGFMHPWLLKIAEWLARRHLEQSVPDPRLREKLTPDYSLGCKRVLLSDDYLVSLTQPNVELHTSPLRAVREHSIVLADGSEHEVDAIIFGTGFQVQSLPIAKVIHGRHGLTLADAWADTMKAHAGTTVSGFPNLFFLMGPNTGLGHSSVVLMVESQIEHVIGALRYLEGRQLAAVEPTPDAQAEFVRYVDSRMQGTVWNQGGCSSWYLDAMGRNSALWPGFISSFKRRVERFEPSEYVAITRNTQASGVSPERRRMLAHG